jgi:uncharacterized membrane protein HdeD (DUF308 family)
MSDVFDRWAGADADAEVLARLREEVARHWKLVLGIGVVSILAGAFAILAPAVASISVTVLVGWALLIGGAVQLAHAFRGEFGWDVAWRLLVAVATVVAGLWILLAPLTGTITLTVVLVAWFWFAGVTRLMAWWRTRDVEGSWTLALSGVLAIVLGILIWADLPSSATWAIGLLVGIDLLFAGADLVAIALAGRELARRTPSAA